ncbi:hypothetical protein TURU_004542 [Turdus rufiventris]|nr:hypothetical protein TURU_004542 [Turdus rufiventris]
MQAFLGMPDLTKPFELFAYERLNVALEILVQHLRDQRRAVAYFSKQLDSVSLGWPGCLKAVVATVIRHKRPIHPWATQIQIIEQAYSSKPDLNDMPLENPDCKLYTDGNSFMRKVIKATEKAILPSYCHKTRFMERISPRTVRKNETDIMETSSTTCDRVVLDM